MFARTRSVVGGLPTGLHAGIQIRTLKIQNVTFKDDSVLSSQLDKKEKMKETIVSYFARSGLDKGGAHSVTVHGGWHSGSLTHGDVWNRTTLSVWDKDGSKLFWKRSDGTFWDVIHVPEDTPANQEVWDRGEVYTPASKQEFDK